MNPVRILALLTIAISLSACAGSVSAPTSVVALPAEQRASLMVSNVTAEAATGVIMTQIDFDRITQRIKAQLAAASPTVLVSAGAPAMSAMTMKIVFTRYDAGNAVARAFLAGLGQIRIDANVVLVDAGGRTVGQYQVSKQFAFGGVIGAATRIEDVEEGFEKSVVEILRPNKA